MVAVALYCAPPGLGRHRGGTGRGDGSFPQCSRYPRRMKAVTPSEGRLRALLEASRAIGSELSPATVLQRLVPTAAELTGAKYAALGVIDPSGLQLESFVTTGVDDETHRAIGDL